MFYNHIILLSVLTRIENEDHNRKIWIVFWSIMQVNLQQRFYEKIKREHIQCIPPKMGKEFLWF